MKKNIYTILNHFAVHLKLTQHCKSTTLYLNFKKWLLKKEKRKQVPHLCLFKSTKQTKTTL